MTTQFIAHAEAPRTFSDKKGATKAIKRDLGKHHDVHGDKLYDTGFEAKPTADGRFGVVVFCDLTPSEAQALVGPELAGYVIEPTLPEPKPAPKAKPTADAAKAKARRRGEVAIEPTNPLVPCRAGTKQQKILDLISQEAGATIADLREVCVKKDGTVWDDNSIRSALYYDMKQKGYGVRTSWNDDEPSYHVVLPEGYDAPLPAKGTSKS